MNMHEGVARFRKIMESIAPGIQVVEVEASTRTAADAAQALGVTTAQIAKSIVFLAGEEPILVIAAGDHRVDPEKLAAIMGRPVKLADPATVLDLTGFEIGGVPPLGHRLPLRTIIDEDLFHHEMIYAAAGSPRAIFACHPGSLVNWTDALVAKVKET
ncbi:MAG: YbaK/EbsC family protein [Kyrpidia tusciae]|nr:YbaK/EbsC family protein [Kyrpidia tusciae]MBE3551973.1 YbaK/EbsC family protein [Kyrpidia tusciae]